MALPSKDAPSPTAGTSYHGGGETPPSPAQSLTPPSSPQSQPSLPRPKSSTSPRTQSSTPPLTKSPSPPRPQAPVSAEVDWTQLSFDLAGAVILRSSLEDGIKIRKTVCQEWNKLTPEYSRMIFPADVIPLLLDCSHDGIMKFYDPGNNVVFEVPCPVRGKIERLCDFRQPKLLTVRSDGLHIMDILTGTGVSWEMLIPTSDRFIIDSSGNAIKAIIASKGSGYNTSVAILKKSRRQEKTFWTEEKFTISPISNPVLRDKKLFCLSTEGVLGVFDLESSIASLYYDDCHDDDANNEDGAESDDDDYASSLDAESDDDDYASSLDAESDDDDEEEDFFHNLDSAAEFLCGSESEMFKILIEEGWHSFKIKKLDKPAMKWEDINHLGETAMFTGTTCSIISKVPTGLQNRVFLPGHQGSATLVKAELAGIEGRFFFLLTEACESFSKCSPWSYPVGERSEQKSGGLTILEKSIWVKFGSRH